MNYAAKIWFTTLFTAPLIIVLCFMSYTNAFLDHGEGWLKTAVIGYASLVFFELLFSIPACTVFVLIIGGINALSLKTRAAKLTISASVITLTIGTFGIVLGFDLFKDYWPLVLINCLCGVFCTLFYQP